MTNEETNGISLRRLKTFLTNLKNIFAEKNHSHATSDITGLDTALSSKATLAQGNKADSAVQSVKIGTTEYKSGTTVTLPSYPTSLPASDVPSWAKQKTKPTYTASEIGLGDVGNFKAVSTVASQGLTDTEKSNARANIGAQVAGSYASSNHNHDDKYQAKGSYASASHTHDDRYYTETEINTKLNGKANASHAHGNGDITSLDASKITSGTISIDRLPQGALERLTVVANDTARFKLTSTSVQKGDTVKVTSTGKMYYVVDESKLSTEDGYEVYAAGTAASVPWSGVTGKPSTYTPSSHTHTKSQITDFPSSLLANGGNSDTVDGFHASQTAGSKKTCVVTDANGYTNLNYINSNTGNSENPSISQVIVTNGSDNYYRKASLTHLKNSLGGMPASDVYSWAKASSKPSYTASEVGAAPANHSHSNYLTGINKSMVVNALGYTPPTTDTNTWRGIQNNLTSTATDQSLSAYQGKILKDLVDKKTTFIYSSTQPTSPASNAVWVG